MRKRKETLNKKVLALLLTLPMVLQLAVGAAATAPEEDPGTEDVSSSAAAQPEDTLPETKPADSTPPESDPQEEAPVEPAAPEKAPEATMAGDIAPAAAVTFNDLMTDGVLSKTQNGSQIANNSLVSFTDQMFLKYTFSANTTQCAEIYGNINSSTITNGTAYYVDFPAGLVWVTSATNNTKLSDLNATVDGNSKKFGELWVDKSNNPNRGIIYFGGAFWTDHWDGLYPDQMPLDSGYIYMGCQLDQNAINNDEDVSIQLTGSKTVTLKVTENQKVDSVLKKIAGSYDADTGRFNWTIEYTPGDKEPLTSHWLHDVFNTDAHEYVAGSMTINGGSFSNQAVAPTVVRDAPSAGKATLKADLSALGTLVAKTKYTITYQTALSDAALAPAASNGALQGSGTTKAENQAFIRDSSTATVNKAESAKVSTSATPDKKQWMVKTGVQDPANGRRVNWTVTIKTMDRRLTNLTMYDNFDTTKHDLVAGSVEVNNNTSFPGITLDTTPGTFTKTTPVSVNRPYQFKISFSNTTTPTTYTVTYQTEVKGTHYQGCDDNLKMDNEAWLDFNWAPYDTGTGPVPPYTWPTINKPTSIHTNVLKKEGVYDPATHTITWRLTLNPYNVAVGAATITDDFTNKGYTYVPGSFKTATYAWVSTTDSGRVTLDAGASTNKKLVLNISAQSPPNDTATEYFIFKTTVDDPLDYAYNSTAKKYYNTAVFKGSFAGNSNFEKDVTAEVGVASEVVKKTAGAYDYEHNTVTWNVVVNKNKMPMPDAKLQDTMSTGQSYVPGSVTYTTSGPPISLSDSGNVDVQSQVLTIDLGALANNQQITVTYKTQLDANKIAGFKKDTSVSVSNNVRLLRNDYSRDDLATSTATKDVGNKVLNKSGTINNAQGYIDYTVDINPNNLDLTGLKLKDSLPDSLALDANTVKLYKANVDASGTFTPNGASLGGAGFLKLNVSADNSFTISLPAGKGRYILEYRCDLLDDKLTYDNSIQFLSGVTGNAASGQGSVNAGSGGGGASAAANRKFSLELTAQDELRPEIKLRDVSYGIFTKIEGVEVCVYECKTGNDGKSTAHPLNLNQEYYIKQLSDFPGYPATKVDDGATTTPIETFTVERSAKCVVSVLLVSTPQSADVGFQVVNDWDRILGDVQFQLTDLAAGSSFAPLTAKSGADGNVSFAGVPMGTYRLKQLTTNIQHHTTNNDDHVVEVHADGSYTIYRAADNQHIQNGKYVNVVKKANITLRVFREENNAPLADSRFQALDKNGKVVGEGVADASGNVTFTDLALGETYTIVEVEVPGYKRSANIQVSLTDENGTHVDWPKNDSQLKKAGDSSSSGSSSGSSSTGSSTAGGDGTGTGGTTPNPGDGAPIALWVGIILAAAIGIVAICALKRRKTTGQ